MKPTQQSPRGRPDFMLLILTLILVGFGLVMVFSASSNIAAVSDRYGHDPLYFTKRQFIWIALGLGFMFILMNITYSWFKKGFILYFVPVFILLALVPFIGNKINGARSWLGIGSLGIQPTEFAKLAIILYLGSLITKKGEKFREFKRGLLPVMIIVGIVCGMVMLQPDLGSCLILAASAGVVIIAGGANLKQVSGSVLVVTAVTAIVVSISILSGSTSWEYRIDRFTSYMDPWADQSDTGYHLSRSLEALGHGGLTGAGFGHSVQKLHYLPFAYNDFIFAIIAEEFGFIGSAIFLLTYLLFIWRGLLIALRCPDVYGTVVGVGIVGLIAIQAVVNIGGVTGTIPITGVTLPMISYGGSSMLVTLASLGILLSISREFNKPVKTERGRGRTLDSSGRPQLRMVK
ncbi:putative lipid II flippase FtsW [Paenibacillus sambharensis]|uniref:Probable peptidoglycan glycosyltransferase FtsW n=1 Tax=Paenibacillus sambharensis TaxID=1803190 RepID=A0A2W1LFK4_9BACL|nr:putative lipid II flippase FtsW [Paenibacillus sambharensis]PZD93812.1 putative lipid II flippase FtsW [Paenibacillus sambharensis]